MIKFQKGEVQSFFDSCGDCISGKFSTLKFCKIFHIIICNTRLGFKTKRVTHKFSIDMNVWRDIQTCIELGTIFHYELACLLQHLASLAFIIYRPVVPTIQWDLVAKYLHCFFKASPRGGPATTENTVLVMLSTCSSRTASLCLFSSVSKRCSSSTWHRRQSLIPKDSLQVSSQPGNPLLSSFMLP